jgi:hypothetical protein
MTGTGVSIGGDWTGVYDYGANQGDPVPFTAMLFDIRGAVWGTITEPNTFVADAGDNLVSDVNGIRSGQEVRFTKTYQGRPSGGEYAIAYTGLVSAGGNRIEGEWRLATPFGSRNGPFVMNRAPGVQAKAVIRGRASVTLSI